MRFDTRFYSALTTLLFGVSLARPAAAAAGLSVSVENLFAPLGKQVETVDETGHATVTFGRETAEWMGVSGFWDLNPNWRWLYGAHMTWLGFPLFKLDTSLAFMLEMPDKLPLQPYFFLGASPVIAINSDLPPLGITFQTGVGVDYSWDNRLYSSLRLNTYLYSLYGEDTNDQQNLQWNPFTFSISVSSGYLF